MQKFLTLAAIGLVTSVGLAQNETTSDAAAQADALLREVVKTYAAAEADALLHEVVETYATANALTDTMTIAYDIPEQPDQEMTATIQIDRGSGNSSFNTEGMSITALDGQLYFESDDVKKKYFQTEITEDLSSTLENVFGGGGGLPFHFTLADGAQVDDLTSALNVGGIANLAVTGFEQAENEEGAMRTIVTMTGDKDGTLTLHVNPKTNLITRSSTTFSSPYQMSDGPQAVTINTTYDPKLLNELPTAITFDPAGRKMVSTLRELQPTPVAVGEVAPDFTLVGNDGKEVTLSDLRGQVVVLDFWATWCGPCKKGLPLLEKFYTWAKKSDPAVKVFAVNVWEQGKTADDRKEVATKYWNAQKFTMPTLFDLDKAVVSEYGVGGIPATFIIGPDGKVSAVHVGFDPKMVDALKKDTREAATKNATAG